MLNEELLKKSYIFETGKGEQIVFTHPHFNEEKKVEFKECSHFDNFIQARFVFDHNQQVIEVINGFKDGKIRISLEGNEELKEDLMRLHKMFTSDTVRFINDLKSGNEKILIFETGNKQYPYWIVTESILKRGEHSSKYVDGLVYFIGQSAKSSGVTIKDYDELHVVMKDALDGVDLPAFPKKVFGDKTGYMMELSDLLFTLNQKKTA